MVELVVEHPEELGQQGLGILHQVDVVAWQQLLQKFCLFVLDLEAIKQRSASYEKSPFVTGRIPYPH